MSELIFLGWDDFERCVELFVQSFKDSDFIGIFGQPRGGLPLAVALSHRLNLPLFTIFDQLIFAPDGRYLWVDDIVDSGTTIEAAKARVHLSNIGVEFSYACMVSKKKMEDLNFSIFEPTDKWVVFPWEDPMAITREMAAYKIRVGL